VVVVMAPALPVGALLQSMVFGKALKQYETVSSGPKQKKGKDKKKKTPKEKAKAKKYKKTEESVMNLMKQDRYASPNVVCPAL
jgi:hypothetical protein